MKNPFIFVRLAQKLQWWRCIHFWVFLLIIACSSIGLSQEIPYQEIGEQTVPTNGVTFTHEIHYPGVPLSGQSIASAPPTTVFNVASDNFVPDCSGAVNSSNVVTMINRRFQVSTKAGSLLTNISLWSFWTQSTNTGTLVDVYDPVIVFDPHSRRFIATAAHEPRKTNAGVLIGVSLTEDPLGAWNLRQVDADSNNLSWGDQPHIGFNDRFIVISVNMFQSTNNNSGVRGGRLLIFDKTNMYAGNYTAPSTITTNENFSLWPASNYDKDDTNMFLLQARNGNFDGSGFLGFGNITGTPSSPVLNADNFLEVTNRTWNISVPGANFAPQLGITNLVNLMDARTHSVIQKNGFVYTVQMIYIPADSPTRSIIQYFKVAPNGTFVRGEIDDGSSFYAYPNIAVNDFNDLIIGYAKFRTNTYPSAAYQVKYWYEQEDFAAEEIFGVGLDYYVFNDASARNRWGDYTTSVVDPSNGRNFWTLGEYATNRNTGASLTTSGRHALRWASVELYAPTNDLFANSITLSGSSGTNEVQLERLTGELGEPEHIGTNLVSAWYSWTAPASGQVQFVTAPTTACAVYTGTSVTNLTLVAQSALPSEGTAPRNARVAFFTATNGTTYRIAQLSYFNPRLLGWLRWNQQTVPTFVEHPSPSTNEVVHGYALTLKGVAIGIPAPTFQWKRNGVNISGATSTNYVISSMTSAHEGSYTLVASNSAGTTTSDATYVKYFSAGAQPLEAPTWTNSTINIPMIHVVGYTYIVYGTTNFTNWVAIKTNTVPFTFTDPQASNYPARFYRSKFVP